MLKSARKKLIFICGLLCFSLNSFADNLLVNNYPDRYVVVQGDTLWDIASRFLNKPWRWPEIWETNPQVKDPHWIYPGDILQMTFTNGKPRLQLVGDVGNRNYTKGNRVRLSPRIRRTPYDKPLTGIPAEIYLQFMSKPYVIGKRDLANSPYIVAFTRNHLTATKGDKAYVRNIKDQGKMYEVVRQGKAYRDGDTGEVLGYEARYIGTARIDINGDPATIRITDSVKEFQLGDRLIPSSQSLDIEDFHPKAPNNIIIGNIISLFDAVFNVGKYSVVVVDRGSKDGLESGDMLDILQKGETIIDRFVRGVKNKVTLPNEQAGQLMIFRTFERVSFGLIMEANKAVRLGDIVSSPNLPR